MKDKTYIETISLFPELNHRLIDMLKDLNREDWHCPTFFPSWKVRDIVAHLLDTAIRRLSLQRDNYIPDIQPSISDYTGLVNYITDIADKWTVVFETVSPAIITALVEEYQDQLYEFLKGLDPLGMAHFSVAWAGEERSFNWFDIAREYTERWHHQMQIRDVLGKKSLYDKHLYYPVLDTFMQALPYHFRYIEREQGYVLCVSIAGESGGKWFLTSEGQSWRLDYRVKGTPDTTVAIANEIAWKIFVKWIDINKLDDDVHISGDENMGKHVLEMTCILR